MNQTEVVEFINSVFAGNPDGQVVFRATPANDQTLIIPNSFAIRIRATARGKSAVCLSVIVFESDDEDDQKFALKRSTATIALELINVLERKIHNAKNAAAKNN